MARTTYLCFSAIIAIVKALNERPIVGILAQEYPDGRNGSVIYANYVKMIEASGARAAPVFINMPLSYYEKMVKSINGLVLPGGDLVLSRSSPHVIAAATILNLAMKVMNNINLSSNFYFKEKNFPILGVCQGHELLIYLTSNYTDDILESCKGTENIAMPLIFKKPYLKTSLYGNISKRIIENLIYKNITMNFHISCLSTKRFFESGLNNFWDLLTVNNDIIGKEFVSSIESNLYPFAGVQFHPEKVIFLWDPKHKTPHSEVAIATNRIFYDWLISKARESPNKFQTLEEEMKSLICNYNLSIDKDDFWEQIYMLD